MFKKILLLLLISASISSNASTQSSKEQRVLRRALDSLIFLYGDGIASTYEGSPNVIRYGRIFGGKRLDAVAYFSLEGQGGSNHHQEYIAFFRAVEYADIADKKSRPYQLIATKQIGARGWRWMDAESMRIVKGKLLISGNQMGDGDALCCPSTPINLTLLVDNEDEIMEKKTVLPKPRKVEP